MTGEEQVYVTYKGYVIQPIPYRLPETDEWNAQVCISRDRPGRWRMNDYTPVGRFKSKDGGLAHAIEYGKQIIDGKVMGVSGADW